MCRFKCDSEETQGHIFENCGPIQARISYPVNVNLKQIFGSLDDQHKVINCLTTIDHVRNLMIDILPERHGARTHVNT